MMFGMWNCVFEYNSLVHMLVNLSVTLHIISCRRMRSEGYFISVVQMQAVYLNEENYYYLHIDLHLKT